MKTGSFIRGLLGAVVISVWTLAFIGCERPDGMYRKYYPSGQLKSEIYYHNGVGKGMGKTYYENGQLKTEGVYKNGKIEGPFKYYFENGRLQAQGIYKD